MGPNAALRHLNFFFQSDRFEIFNLYSHDTFLDVYLRLNSDYILTDSHLIHQFSFYTSILISFIYSLVVKSLGISFWDNNEARI